MSNFAGLKCNKMFGKIGDMLGKLQEIKQKIAEIKAKMEAAQVDVSSPSGEVKITVNGNRRVLKLQVDPALQHAGKEELEKQLLETMNKAIEEANKLNEAEMKKVAGGFLPPGIL